MSRAHGYLLKAPIDAKGVMGVIEPWWAKRFGEETEYESLLRPSDRSASFDLSDSYSYDVFRDIEQTMEVISALCKVESDASLRNRWKTIQERLLALKGDLKSSIKSSANGNDDLDVVLCDIETLRLGKFPRNLRQRWSSINQRILGITRAHQN